MATRKMQMEIDKALKKVAEGVVDFEAAVDKLNTSTNPTQREKYELELKKEIKKLQRSRDQIKTWINSSEIKDKRALLENRRLIETQMERFKAIEKELKTKAFSKEGLGLPDKIDPEVVKKQAAVDWINETVDRLNQQIDGLEAQQEQLQVAGGKRGKKSAAKEQMELLVRQIERHRKHIRKLEIALRMLENGFLEPDQIDEIKENVEYYLETYEDTEDDYLDVYDSLSLEEDVELFGTTILDDHLVPSLDKARSDEAELDHVPPATPSVTTTRKPASTPARKNGSTTTTPAATPALPTPSKPPSAAPSPKMARADQRSSTPTPTPTTPPAAVPPTVPPPPPKLTAWNQAAKQGTAQATTAAAATAASRDEIGSAPGTPASAMVSVAASRSASPSVRNETPKSSGLATPPGTAAAAVPPSKWSSPPSSANVSTLGDSQSTSRGATPSTLGFDAHADAAELDLASSATAAGTASLSHAGMTDGDVDSSGGSSDPAAPALGKAERTTLPAPGDESESTSVPAAAPVAPIAEPLDNRIPSSLADLVAAFQTARSRAFGARTGTSTADTTAPLAPRPIPTMLDAALASAPMVADSERGKPYVPQRPYVTPGYYPQQPAAVLGHPALYERLELDTLFFMFYFQPGTYAQYMAARELKRQSWRYHKQYRTWFQRHNDPAAMTDEYELGTYLYFDHESAWRQQTRDQFKFEYRYLEDTDMA
ncbi:general negative regulator of transcription subunit 5 [Allomyces javanicus]|nr:general negative regulator of transcription subunit 5 [Allomyces javanicus]